MTRLRNGWMPDEPDPERRLARDAKAAGHLRSEYLLRRISGVHSQAVAQGWSSDRLAQAVDEIEKLANEVWGKLQ